MAGKKQPKQKVTPEQRLRNASRAMAEERRDEAIRLLRPLIGKPLGPEDQSALAALLQELDHPEAEAARTRAEEALAGLRAEGTGASLYSLARALTLLGRDSDALAALGQSLGLAPASPEAGMLALRLHLAAGDPEGAVAALTPVLAALPDSRRARLNAVKALGVAGHADAALALLAPLRGSDKEGDGAGAGEDDPEVGFIAAGLEGRDAEGQGAMAAAVFDGFAESYDTNLAQIGNNGPAMIGQVLARLAPAKGRVLDAGCGTGLCAPILRPYARELTGCDISVPMLEKARDKRGYDALTRSDLGAPMTLPKGPYDLIVAADVMTYFGDLSAVLRGLAGVLAPGGWIVFTLEEAADPKAPAHALAPTGRYRHQVDGAAAMLTAAGLTRPAHVLRDTLRTEFGQPVPGVALAAQKLALFG